MKIYIVLVAIICYLAYSEASTREVLCGACKAVIDEVDYAIKKTGRKNTKESDMIGLLEKICEEMNNYALSEDNSGKKSYVRFNSRAGESVTLNNVRIDSNTMKELKDACTTLISKFDDDIIDLYVSKEKNIKRQLCHSLTGYCKGQKSEL